MSGRRYSLGASTHRSLPLSTDYRRSKSIKLLTFHLKEYKDKENENTKEKVKINLEPKSFHIHHHHTNNE